MNTDRNVSHSLIATYLITWIASAGCVVGEDHGDDPGQDGRGDGDPKADGVIAAGRPVFQAPFACDQSWTYSHHSAEVRRALDFVANATVTDHAPVLASAAGTATRRFQSGGAGNYVVIDHGAGWQTYYFHLSSYSVASGAPVQQGQEIGRVGTSGASSGPHLHYEQLLDGVGQPIALNGQALDPYPSSYGVRSVVSGNCGACGVQQDGKLYCNNRPAELHAQPSAASPVIDQLRSSFSYFDCWRTGELHAGNNTTWYRTLGDDQGAVGWVAAVHLRTTSAFDADPTALGLAACP